MKTSLYHIQVNISDPKKSLPFYKNFFKYFEYKIIDEGESYIGVINGTTDFWIMETEKEYKNSPFHRKNTGLNHLAFKVGTKNDVNKFVEQFLKPRDIKPLYDSPKPVPEYMKDYYAVFFEDPDRIKLEVMYKS